MAHNVPHFAMFGAGTILARSATPAPNMGVATAGSGAAKCVLYDGAKNAFNYFLTKSESVRGPDGSG